MVEGVCDLSVVEIVGLNLQHINGCDGGTNHDMNYILNKRSGCKCSDHVLAHPRSEVKASRYSTKDIQGRLKESGYNDITYNQAVNVRYRLLKDTPFKSWGKLIAEEQGGIEDFLTNTDLKNEVIAGGQESIVNLCTFHEGPCQQFPGYNYRLLSTDSKRHFLVHLGKQVVCHDSHSGINTSGFCF